MDVAKSEIALTRNSGHATTSYLARPSPFILLRMLVPILTSVFGLESSELSVWGR